MILTLLISYATKYIVIMRHKECMSGREVIYISYYSICEVLQLVLGFIFHSVVLVDSYNLYEPDGLDVD